MIDIAKTIGTHILAAMAGGSIGIVALLILQSGAMAEREAIIRHALRLLRESATGNNVDQIIDLKRRAESIGIFTDR